jgi:hypothetical protein
LGNVSGDGVVVEVEDRKAMQAPGELDPWQPFIHLGAVGHVAKHDTSDGPCGKPCDLPEVVVVLLRRQEVLGGEEMERDRWLRGKAESVCKAPDPTRCTAIDLTSPPSAPVVSVRKVLAHRRGWDVGLDGSDGSIRAWGAVAEVCPSLQHKVGIHVHQG